eukprot:TRINITY_DN2053_c0_g3_i1.p2 TRINITY_DN2053_c0_g3~~TRINITY_DN2053_c0_g3_i1.p2  ORF type:complete len:118 (-),score=13.51 TRINITY_DN2053_c0_g3_i1:416-736(-)
MLVVVAYLQAAESQAEKLKQLTIETRELSLKEKGCITYNFHITTHDPNLFCAYEEWQDIHAFREHLKYDYTKNMLEAFKVDGGTATLSIYEMNRKIEMEEVLASEE